MTLDDIRKEIDQLDDKIIELLNQRMDRSIEVAKIKSKTNINVLNTERENQILDKVEQKSNKHAAYIKSIYEQIIGFSRELQHVDLNRDNQIMRIMNSSTHNDMPCIDKIACQGAEGAFSHLAANQLFGNCSPAFYQTFEEVFQSVEIGAADIGLLPVENSNVGSVSEVYDLILKYKHYIVGAVNMRIEQNLLGCEGASIDTIDTVYSHPQAINQCSKFLQKHKLQAVADTNTAAAACRIAAYNDKTIAAIGSAQASSTYNLKILAPAIENCGNNITRFIAISKILNIPPTCNKISLVFTLPHKEGSLSRVLARFAHHGFNLTKIESRTTGANFEYQFYLDFEANSIDNGITSFLSALYSEIPQLIFLGNYREIKISE